MGDEYDADADARSVAEMVEAISEDAAFGQRWRERGNPNYGGPPGGEQCR